MENQTMLFEQFLSQGRGIIGCIHYIEFQAVHMGLYFEVKKFIFYNFF